MFKKSVTIVMILALLIISIKGPAYASSYPNSLSYKWTSNSFKAFDSYGPKYYESGYTSVFYYTRKSSVLNSFIVYNSLGKVVYKKENDVSVGKIGSIEVTKKSIVIESQKGLKKIDFKGKQQWFNKSIYGQELFTTASEGIFILDRDAKKIYKINPTNGKILWSYKINSNYEILKVRFDPKTETFTIVTKNTLFVMNNNKLRWKVSLPRGQGIDDISISRNGTVAIQMYDNNGYFLKVYSNQGKLKWQYRTKDLFIRNSVFNNNDYFCILIDGKVIWFDTNGKTISSFNLSESYFSPSVFSATNDLKVYVSYYQRDSKYQEHYYIRKFDKNGKMLAQSQTNGFDFKTYPNQVYTVSVKSGNWTLKSYQLK
ncbi:PQQ-binding-like beta-propeller repeat protein [Neobacillus soli]|uniref:PQQ-binding-like beta-propeller repeat protein n=1 Tax=Neobacillus soli TaxID=220688 RepID=UPI0008253768|nr:PQQ-binding-like beta-propeller repeat protein [Neobacillus soli]